MPRAILFALVFLFVTTTGVGAFEWAGVAKRVQASVVSLSTVEGDIYCTGFVIDNRRDFVMTAAHCVEPKWIYSKGLVIDKRNAWVIWQDNAADLAVLQAPGVNRKELAVGNEPEVGQDVAAFGFGYGIKGLGMFRSGEVSSTGVEFPEYKEMPGKWVMYNFAFISGMSGGPITDMDGKVVGIVQRSNDVIGLGRGVTEIYAATKDLWAK